MIDRCDDHQLCVCVCTCVGGGAGRGGGGAYGSFLRAELSPLSTFMVS